MITSTNLIISTVLRRIGGLETLRLLQYRQHNVLRRIGGLEMKYTFVVFYDEVLRRIGGLEITSSRRCN